MKTNWAYRFFKFLKKFYSRNERRVVAYFICVVIATGFWFLNALSKMYTVELEVPVEYYNFPENKTFAGRLPKKFEFMVRAHGFTILRQKMGLLLGPLEFNVNEMTNSRMTESKGSKYAFPTRQFLSELSYQMSGDLELLSMRPDTLYFGYGRLSQRQVKVKPVVKMALKKQYQLAGDIKATPKEVLVSGPKEMIDTLQFVYTKTLEFNNVEKTFDTKAEIRQIDGLYYSRPDVELKIPVDEYTEAQQSVPVTVEGAPQGINVKLFPARVKISFLVGLSQFSEIRPENFSLAVSYDDIEKGGQRLPVNKLSVPPFLYDVKISPEEVEYLIEK